MVRYSVSIKGLVTRGSEILLALNERDEWELLGGRIEPGEPPMETVRREVFEEAGIRVNVGAKPIDSYLFEVLGPGSPSVFVVTYPAVVDDPNAQLTVSDEHSRLAWFEITEALELPNLPDGYKASIRTLPL